MKKTMLTMAVAGLLLATTVQAEKPFENRQNPIALFSVNEASTFCKAIMQGDLETVMRLIELGEDVNKKSLGMTPAIFAARYNKAEILKLLIASGADLTIRSDKGFTVKKYAELSNATEALEVLEAAR